eukprot:1161956-Pelagomonas_calceolata.AAC.11
MLGYGACCALGLLDRHPWLPESHTLLVHGSAEDTSLHIGEARLDCDGLLLPLVSVASVWGPAITAPDRMAMPTLVLIAIDSFMQHNE